MADSVKNLIDNIAEAFNGGNLILTVSAVIIVIIALPFTLIMVSKTFRLWLKSGIEGENERLDLDEIVKMSAIFVTLGSFLLLAYMVITHGLNGTEWPIEYLIFITAVSAGADATLIATIFSKLKKP